jgi:hypothetical protein
VKRNRTIRSYTMNIDGSLDDVFPLLCPVREYDWIQPWHCEIIYTDSGIAELDCVFKTNFPDDGQEDTWVVSKYEPPKCIEFVRINSLRSIRYSIELIQQENGSTQANWKQIVTGLNSEGDIFVAGLIDEAYHRKMKTLQNMINHYLKTGEMLKIM